MKSSRLVRLLRTLDVHDLIGVVGFACLTHGAALLHPAAGWLTAGVLLIAAFALPYARDARRHREGRS